MAKKKEQGQASEKDERARSAAPVNEDLGEFAGITMPEKDPAKEGGDAQAAPADEVVLSVEEDRARLLVQGGLYLLLAFLGLFLISGGVGATQISQNVAYLLLVLVGLPLAWFSSKAMGRRLGKFFSHVGVVDFGAHGVTIYEGADPKRALTVSYKDIKNYKVVRHGKSLRLLLSGAWVTHPSGIYLVAMNRPFMESTLPALEGDVKRVMREHRVNERK